MVSEHCLKDDIELERLENQREALREARDAILHKMDWRLSTTAPVDRWWSIFTTIDKELDDLEKVNRDRENKRGQSRDFELFERCRVGDVLDFDNGAKGLVIRSSPGIPSHDNKSVLMTNHLSGAFWGDLAVGYFNHDVKYGEFTVSTDDEIKLRSDR